MATLDPKRTKRHLDAFDWDPLFREELGWLKSDGLAALELEVGGEVFGFTPVAHLGGVVAFEVASPDGRIPGTPVRRMVHKAVEPSAREHILLFTDGRRTQTVWSYPVYDGTALKTARSHHFVKGQPPDLFISKLAGLFFDMEELSDSGDASLVEVTRRVRSALDVEQVTKKFYAAFKGEQEALAERHITGIDAERTRRHYASVLLTRLMFVYFLQKKGFLDSGDRDYLGSKLAAHQAHIRGILDPPSLYRRFLRPLFFEGFALRPAERSDETNALLGDIRYLNGGLFLEHPIEEDHPDLDVADAAVEGILGVFDRFTWHLDDTPGGRADEINPDVLGYILEKYVNQKAFGAYYTPPELTGYLCDATLDRLLVERLSDDAEASATLDLPARRFDSLADLLTNLDDDLAWRLLGVLKEVTVLDPACGSGAFLVAALKKLLTVYKAVLGHAELSKDANLKGWLAEAHAHPSTGYFLKKEVITRNLYGVDLMPEATEIAKLRLFLALVASAERPEDLEPLPNIDFNLLDGNSLVGLLDVSDEALVGAGDAKVGAMFAAQEFRDSLREKDRLVDLYRGTAETVDRDDDSGTLLQIRDRINTVRAEGQRTLDQVAAEQMHNLGVKVKEATWDGKKARYATRRLAKEDVAALRPFHWAYEFSRILARGGFDVIVTNPPWDILKPNDKEFFETRSDAVSKNTMRIEDFTTHRAAFLAAHPEVQAEYEDYLTSFPHQSAYFRSAPEYGHQVSEVNGRKQSSDLNLYKLFLERCFRLLHDRGHCGIVIPSGIYTDLGTKGLRQMLFEETSVTALFGFENRKLVFEEVDSRFKFVILTFEKAGTTERFPATFMRHDPAELARFPDEGAVEVEVEAVKRLAAESWGLMEFAVPLDAQIAEKMAQFPALGDEVAGAWQIGLTAEFHMTNHAGLFETEPGPGRLALWEGKMVHQFDADFAASRYWVDEAAGREALTKRGMEDAGQDYDYQAYRLGFRDIAASTNERTLISAIIPPPAFHGNKVPTVKVFDEEGERLVSDATQLYLCAVWNSFTLDWLLRKQVTTTINFFYVYQLPVPRLREGHPAFDRLAELAARLVCTTPAFDALAATMGLGDHTAGVTDATHRARRPPRRDRRPRGAPLRPHRSRVHARPLPRRHHRLPPRPGRRPRGRARRLPRPRVPPGHRPRRPPDRRRRERPRRVQGDLRRGQPNRREAQGRAPLGAQDRLRLPQRLRRHPPARHCRRRHRARLGEGLRQMPDHESERRRVGEQAPHHPPRPARPAALVRPRPRHLPRDRRRGGLPRPRRPERPADTARRRLLRPLRQHDARADGRRGRAVAGKSAAHPRLLIHARDRHRDHRLRRFARRRTDGAEGARRRRGRDQSDGRIGRGLSAGRQEVGDPRAPGGGAGAGRHQPAARPVRHLRRHHVEAVRYPDWQGRVRHRRGVRRGVRAVEAEADAQAGDHVLLPRVQVLPEDRRRNSAVRRRASLPREGAGPRAYVDLSQRSPLRRHRPSPPRGSRSRRDESDVGQEDTRTPRCCEAVEPSTIG